MTLNEIYTQLDIISDELDDYAENSDNTQIISDIAGRVRGALDNAIFELNLIVDDHAAGLYEDDGEIGFDGDFEEEEEF
jgi:hypothetical protein|tara:strand:- start:330 stop:566 length:237 start_codon:yes stop_codon:yes gene_type:complete